SSAALIRPPERQSLGPPGADGRTGGPAVGRLRFELDDHHRWSLWYYGEGSPVPLVRGAEIVAWVGDHPLTLAELEDSTVGNRRPPATPSWCAAEPPACGSKRSSSPRAAPIRPRRPSRSPSFRTAFCPRCG